MRCLHITRCSLVKNMIELEHLFFFVLANGLSHVWCQINLWPFGPSESTSKQCEMSAKCHFITAYKWLQGKCKQHRTDKIKYRHTMTALPSSASYSTANFIHISYAIIMININIITMIKNIIVIITITSYPLRNFWKGSIVNIANLLCQCFRFWRKEIHSSKSFNTVDMINDMKY